jgi:hypothetical protein
MFNKIKEFFTGKQPVVVEVPYKVEAVAPNPTPEVKVESVAPKAPAKKQQFEKKAAAPKTPAKPRAPRKPKSEAAK